MCPTEPGTPSWYRLAEGERQVALSTTDPEERDFLLDAWAQEYGRARTGRSVQLFGLGRTDKPTAKTEADLGSASARPHASEADLE